MRPIGFAKKYAYAAAATAYLFTLGVHSPRHRTLLTRISEHFGYSERPDVPLRLESVELSELAPPDTRVRLREPMGVDGNVSLYELVTITTLVASQQPRVLFEIGTFDGRTTLNLAANSPADARIFTLDLPREDLARTDLALDEDDRKYVNKAASGTRFRNTAYAARITQLYGDSATFDYAPFEGGVDLVFVDGSHAYDYVISDSHRALSLLRGGRGMILWHDYGQWTGVTRALNELRATDRFAGLRHIAGTSLVCLQVG